MQVTTPHQTAAEIHDHLELLYLERAVAAIEGLAHNAHYMNDLEDEIGATRDAYIGAAVTEIAVLQARLGARLQG